MADFINYAHRGASEYAPENTMMAFHLGLYMGANGIETDVQLTKDGVPVLFHDDKLSRVTGAAGGVADYTFAELRCFRACKNALEDCIPTLEEFLQAFGWRDITFAIELKSRGTARPVADMVRALGLEKKVVATSFVWEELCDFRAYAPEIETGFLVRQPDEALEQRLLEAGVTEICPHAKDALPENVRRWHDMGLRVRAWGVKDEELMRRAYDAGVDGMTVNFPDRLAEYMKQDR